MIFHGKPRLLQCAFYQICIKMSKYHKNGRPKNEISGSGELFFDFRGMILALLVFDHQEYCIFIDKCCHYDLALRVRVP